MMTVDLSDAEVANLPSRKGLPPARHIFGCEMKITADVSPSGFEQKEKT